MDKKILDNIENEILKKWITIIDRICDYNYDENKNVFQIKKIKKRDIKELKKLIKEDDNGLSHHYPLLWQSLRNNYISSVLKYTEFRTTKNWILTKLLKYLDKGRDIDNLNLKRD